MNESDQVIFDQLLNSYLMKWIKRFFYFLFFLYSVACVLLYFNQERIIFLPSPLASSFSFSAGDEINIPVADNVNLNGLWLRSPNSKGVILYWHGNKGSNRRCLHQAQNLYGLGYDVFMPDYRGFGKSGGKIYSEKQLMADAQKAYDYLLEHYKEKEIALLGYSLGSGIAAHLAMENNPQQLFMVAPYKSMVAMKNLIAPFIPSFLMKYQLRTDKILTQIDCPITLFHGTNDELIPYEHSVFIQNQQPNKIKLVTLKGVGHRKAIFSNLLRSKLGQALN